jgi:hypothetical protein
MAKPTDRRCLTGRVALKIGNDPPQDPGHRTFTVIVTIIIIFLLLYISTENGFLPNGSGTTIRHNTQKYT